METTYVQDFAEAIAADVLGIPKADVSAVVAAGSGSIVGIDWLSLTAFIQAIMEMIANLIDSCPQNDEALRDAIKKPGLWQRVRVRRVTREVCYSCSGVGQRWRNYSGRVADALIEKAAVADDETIDAIVDQVRNSSW